MPKVVFSLGEMESGSENTQLGVAPVGMENIFLQQVQTLDFRYGTESIYAEEMLDGDIIQFHVSEPRNWVVIFFEKKETLEIKDLDTKTTLATLNMTSLRNTIIPRIQYTEFTSAELPSFQLAANKYKGKSGIFICGFDQLYYIDDDLILKPFKATTENGEISLEYPSDIVIFQRRFLVIAQTAASTFREESTRATVLGMQHILLSGVDIFDQFIPSVNQAQSGIDLTAYLEPYEWLYTSSSILDAVYIATTTGWRQLSSADRTQDIIAPGTAIQEVIGYGEGVCTKVQFFSGALIFATKKGLRYKLPSATFYPDAGDTGESALPIFSVFNDEIIHIENSKKDQKLFILLKNGEVKTISEGQPIQAGLKTFPISSYIYTKNFKVLDISQQTRTYFAVWDIDGFLHILRESDKITPLADGVMAIKLTTTVTSSTNDTVTFPENSQIVLNNTPDLWVKGSTMNYWLNIFQLETLGNIYKKNSVAGSLTGLAGQTIEYLPTTTDIRPYLPLAFQEHTLRSIIFKKFPDPDYPGVIPQPDPAAWYYKGIEITISGQRPNGRVFGNKSPTLGGVYVFSGFFEFSALKDTLGIQIATSATHYTKTIGSFTDVKTTNNISFGWCLNAAIGALKAYKWGGGHAYAYIGRSAQNPIGENSQNWASNLTFKSTATEKPFPDKKNLVWIYSVFPLWVSETGAPDMNNQGLWIDGEKQEVVYTVTKNKAYIGSTPETTCAESIYLQSTNNYDGKLRKIYCSSLFMHNQNSRDLGFDIFNIDQAKAYFCTPDSSPGYYRPKVVTTKASVMHFQDQYNCLKNQTTDEIFKVSGTGLSVKTINLKPILNEGME